MKVRGLVRTGVHYTETHAYQHTQRYVHSSFSWPSMLVTTEHAQAVTDISQSALMSSS